MNGERSWRLNALLTVALGVGLVVVLIFRPPFDLPTIAVPTGVSAVVESGTTGAQSDESGIYWWITSPEVTVRVVNNDPTPATVELRLELTNAPCPTTRDVEIDGRATELVPGGADRLVIDRIELDAFQRQKFVLRTGGEPCPPTATEPRELYLRVSELDVVEQ